MTLFGASSGAVSVPPLVGSGSQKVGREQDWRLSETVCCKGRNAAFVG